ncbi:MAG: glycosyltransferase family 2 protein [Ilumatobacter sp.]|nr:glycosyltransferase family 2 protein [Ilumatobacter sp.]
MITTARRVLAATSAASGVSVGATAAYLATISVAGVLPRRTDRASTGSTPTTRFMVLVPAHDEEAVIAEALEAFDRLDYPPDLYDVHVVADNCTDRTADIVEASRWTVHRRDDPDQRGKGPALNWLFDRVAARASDVDAVVVVDADASLDPGFLRVMDAAVRGGASVVQGFYSVRNPEPSPAASFRFAALACRHRLRPLGRTRLGASAGLYGSGMVFAREVLADRRWSGHLVEDAELQNELLLDGILVAFEPDAVLLAEIPQTTEAARTQNERWERGRIDLARRFVPQLLRRLPSARGRRVAHLDAVLDHLTPPLSVLVVAGGAGAVSSALAAFAGSRPARPLVVIHLAAIAVIGIHACTGLVSVGADRRHVSALAKAPVHIAWKARLWFSMLSGRRDVDWIRTRRNTEPAGAS